MVPKEFAFIQSETACGLCTGLAWRFPGLSATARDGKFIQMPHSCHHVETIRHRNSSYVTTKLYGTSTCGCNNNTIFSKRVISNSWVRVLWLFIVDSFVWSSVHDTLMSWYSYFQLLSPSALTVYCGFFCLIFSPWYTRIHVILHWCVS